MTLHGSLRALSLVLALGALLTVAACGGGGGGDSGPGVATLTFAPSTDVTLQSNGNLGTAPGLHVGQVPNVGMSAGVRFPLFPFVDSGDTILSAKLRMRQSSVIGDPYLVHGIIVVDYVDFGPTLGAGDHAATVTTSNVGTLSNSATLGIKELDVTAQVIAAAAANDFTVDFIVRFSAIVPGGAGEYASFEEEEGGLGSPDGPELVVTYQ